MIIKTDAHAHTMGRGVAAIIEPSVAILINNCPTL